MTPATFPSLAKPARHDLLLVEPGDWPAVLDASPARPALSPDAVEAVRGWAAAGRPVVARRPAPGDPRGAVPVGLPLPPSLGKARLALAIPAGVPWRPAPPVTLAAAAAPAAWRNAVAALLALADALGLAPRVFGAVLWQAATGLAYLGPGSDLDLLWPVADPRAIGPLLDGLDRIAADAPMALDGEVLVELDERMHGVVHGVVHGLQWRELAEARRTGGVVLAKSLRRAGFVPAAAVLGGGSFACR